MRTRSIVIFVACLVVLFTASGSWATHSPANMNVQGRLTDDTGAPVPAGFKQFTFKIFDAPTGGTEIWPAGPGEEQAIATDDNGLWDAAVGAVTPLSAAVFADTARWLEIRIDDGINPPETLSRVKINTSPYVWMANEAEHSDSASVIEDLCVTTPKVSSLAITTDKLDNSAVQTAKIDNLAVTTEKLNDLAVTTGKIDDLAVTTAKLDDLAATTEKLNDLAVTNGKIANNAVTSDKIASGAVELTDINQNGATDGQVMKWDGSQWVVGYEMPSGVIVMWSGTAATIPPGWALCDGSNGTPDLRNRFVMGATNAGGIGGSSNASIASHTHTVDPPNTATSSNSGSYCSVWEAGGQCVASNNHTHTVNIAPFASYSGGAQTISVIPPYYNLAYIMKL